MIIPYFRYYSDWAKRRKKICKKTFEVWSEEREKNICPKI